MGLCSSAPQYDSSRRKMFKTITIKSRQGPFTSAKARVALH
jgi:hypothetical protein